MQGATVLYAALAALIAIVAMQTQLNFLFWIFGVMVAGIVLSALIGGFMISGLKIRRLDPHHGAVVVVPARAPRRGLRALHDGV